MIWNDIIAVVERARRGDRVAMGELCERFRPMVFGAAMARLRNPAEAEEVVQEAFLHCMRKLPQLRDAACFAGWLRRIAVRMALNKLTRRGPFQGVDADVLERAEARDRTPLDSMLNHEQRDTVRAALARLKPLDRETLVAFYVRGESLKQISDECAAPVGTIKRRLHVARRRLRRCLENTSRGKRARATEQAELVCV